jgi:hypothetical protein
MNMNSVLQRSAKYLSYAALAIIPITLMKPMKIYFDSTSTSPTT